MRDVKGYLMIMAAAILNIFSRHILKRYTVWTMTAYTFLAASVFWLAVNPLSMIVAQSPSAPTWAGLVLLAIISVLIPHSLFFAGLRSVVASRGVITSTLEPVVAMATAALFLGEFLQPVQIVGAALVAGAILLLQMKQEEQTINSTTIVQDANAA